MDHRRHHEKGRVMGSEQPWGVQDVAKVTPGELVQMRHDLRELRTEIDRHHADFERVRRVACELEGTQDYDFIAKRLRAIVG